MGPARNMKEFVKRALIRAFPPRLLQDRRYFGLWQERGVHATPVHFYQPVPDTRKFDDAFWNRRSEMPSVDLNDRGQCELLERFIARYKAIYDQFPREKTSNPREFYLNNGAFPTIDAEVLYCMIREFRPRRIYEIGAGFSTLLSAKAIADMAREGGPACELVSIEPYPNQTIKQGLPGLSRLIQSPVQDVPVAEFQRLEDRDILFIDSSHVVAIGSDVVYEVLEILPRLAKGVLVHFHDIFFPADYLKHWVDELRLFWNEQYLLHAFLCFNRSFEVLWGTSYMHVHHPNLLEKAFNGYRAGGEWPATSFWMRKIQ